MRHLVTGITLAALAETISAESMYNPLKSEVSIYNTVNYPKQVTNNREKGISIVQFYKFGGTPSFAFLSMFFRSKLKARPGLVREVRNRKQRHVPHRFS